MSAVLAAGGVALAAGPALAAQNFMDPIGPVAKDQLSHFWGVVGITLIAIVPVLVGVPLILWRYRRGAGGAYRPHWDFNGWLETAMWGVPIVLVAILGGWLWHDTHKLDPYKPLGPDPLEVQVIGLNWKWVFIYPEQGVATVDELVVPVDRPVTLHLTADTVMQSLGIPAVVGQIYAMPGMQTDLNFVVDEVARVEGRNTQFNGDGFADQYFELVSMTADDFDDWVAKAQGQPRRLDPETYAILARPGTIEDAKHAMAANEGRDETAEDPSRALVFGSVQAGVYDTALHRYMGLVPPHEQPGAPSGPEKEL